MSDWSPEHDTESQFGEELANQRPVPSASFRGALGRYLARDDPGYGPRPEHLWLLVAGCTVAGLLLMLAGLLIAVGTL